MTKTKKSINITYSENNGQQSFFGHDNIFFKTINMSKKQHFKNICCNFKLKQTYKKRKLFLPFFSICN